MARHLQVLEGLEAVRKRPGMYIGSTDSRGLMHCVWEIIDNAVDEALAGVCDRIEVVLMADGSVEVRDNGRGIPVDLEPRTGLSGVEVVFTKLHAGGKFGGGSYNASGGLHGVGASVVNALSARLDVEVDRGGRTYAMSFRRGEPGVFEDALAPGAKTPGASFTAYVDNSELRIIGKTARSRTGCRVHYWPDHQIFIKEAAVTYDELVSRARQTSYLIPGLTLVIRDERRVPGTPGEHGPHEETFLHHGGISEFAEFLAVDPALTDVWRVQGSGTFRETVPVLDERGHMTPNRGRARLWHRHRAEVGHRLRDQGRVVRQHHRHAQGWHPHDGLRAVAAQGVSQAAGDQRPPAQGRGGQSRQGRHPGWPHCCRHRAAGRAAVRGPDQGGAGHISGPCRRGQGHREGADREADLEQAG